jgi:RND family efflux transporter MFP subunit
MRLRSCRLWLLCLVLLPAGVAVSAADEPGKPPQVPIARPVVRQVTDYEDFTGRVEASQRVAVRPFVTGILLKVACQEGTEVKKGDLLFEIDPRLYQIELNQALAQVEVDKAALRLAQANPQAKAEVDLALARVRASEARAELHKFNLSLCKVIAPISGRIARTDLTPGNLVTEKQTVLADLIDDQPVHVSFGVDERTYLQALTALREGKGETRKPPVAIGLASEEDFPHRGVMDNVDSSFNNETGTIRMRAVLPNPERRLVPGMVVRVRLTLGAPRKALLVVDRAIGADLDRNYVYVIDAENKVQFRLVNTGPLQPDGLRVISKGLEPEDRVVIGRLSVLQAGMSVRPQAAEMPVLKRPQPPKEAPPRQEEAALPRRQGGAGTIVEAPTRGPAPRSLRRPSASPSRSR